MQFVEPSDIQRQLIPAALSGRDIMGQARTGTGKTAAFGLPILQQINPTGRLQGICLAPTRELAVQVGAEIMRLAEFAKLRVVCVYGGAKVVTQAHQLGRKPHLVVGTPGRVLDFLQRGVLQLNDVRFAVLDEVDRMLDIGFRDDIRTILGKITSKHQTIFVSATIDSEIKNLARRYMTDPVEINVSQDRLTVDEVEQSFVTVDPHDKFRVLRLLLTQENPPISIVFCNTRHGARKLAKKLHEAGFVAAEIHGDLIQRKRERVMDQFRKHQIRVLVATDLAARGIDVSAVSHIFNYDLPEDPEIYVHRIGRTARMGARGVAVSLASRDEGKELTAIEALINRELPKREVEGFSPSQPRTDHDPHRAPVSKPMAQTRFQQPVLSSAGDAEVKMPPKTLGSRFKPHRSRRR
ncbi:MAG: DEAD/DEAH box helicase [Planctomycetes bacterium]|nr:DEAD/DEAH box helicase [Planctomycetota bacterium]